MLPHPPAVSQAARLRAPCGVSVRSSSSTRLVRAGQCPSSSALDDHTTHTHAIVVIISGWYGAFLAPRNGLCLSGRSLASHASWCLPGQGVREGGVRAEEEALAAAAAPGMVLVVSQLPEREAGQALGRGRAKVPRHCLHRQPASQPPPPAAEEEEEVITSAAGHVAGPSSPTYLDGACVRGVQHPLQRQPLQPRARHTAQQQSQAAAAATATRRRARPFFTDGMLLVLGLAPRVVEEQAEARQLGAAEQQQEAIIVVMMDE